MGKLLPKILIVTKCKKLFFYNFLKKKKFLFLVKNPLLKRDLEYLKTYNQKKDYLISFSSGYIFTPQFLSNFRKCFNFHPASPSYRGRDTQHFACFNRATFFGGTVHLMNNKINKKKIVKFLKKKITLKEPEHKHYNSLGLDCIKTLFKNEFYNLVSGNYIFSKKYKWGKKLYTRKFFLEKLCIKKKISLVYYKHLLKSFHNRKYPSLHIIKNSKKIYLKKNKDYYKITNNYL